MPKQTYPAQLKAQSKAKASLPNWKPKAPKAAKFVPYYGGKGGTMSSGEGWGGEKPLKTKKSSGKTLGSFKKGGKVKKTGKYNLHKGEVVVPVKKVKKMKVMKSANPGDLFNKFAKKKK